MKQIEQIVTVRATANGLPCWHQLRVSKSKLPLMARLEAGEAIDVKTLGEIIASGWGQPPATETDYDAISS